MTSAALFAAMAAALLIGTPPIDRLRRVPKPSTGAPQSLRHRLGHADLWTSPLFAAGLAAFGVTRFVSGWTGVIAGVVAGVVVHRWIGALESADERHRRQQVVRDLPLAVDLIVAALAAGRPTGAVLTLVGSAVGGPLGDDLRAINARLELGADPLEVWREVSKRPGLQPLGRSFARAVRTGASVSVVLGRCVDDLRSERRAAAQQVARSVGVKTAAPLGACFLPAFIVVGIVPTIVGAFHQFVF